MATVVSIGRGTREGQLSSTEWALFKHETYRAVEMLTPVVFEGEGYGKWEDATEIAFTVIGAGTLGGEAEQALYGRLALMAENYGQDAIAVTIAETDFVTP